ncbi:MAG: hypothetical protein EBQ80_01305 [Proteobacteria bacterium]|nr:hypothetical protein [Pseudomonadota bacterium]
MARLRGEYVYTSTGRQRPVFLQPDCVLARFALAAGERDVLRLEVSHDPLAVVRKGSACWQVFEGGMGGGLHGVSALRVVADRLEGWAILTVEQECEGDEQ